MAQPALVTGGQITLFDFYPCVGATITPCTSADTLELMVGSGETASLSQPDGIIVHIDGYAGRGYASGKPL